MPSSALRSRRVWRVTLATRRLRAGLRTIVSARYSRGPQPWARLPIRLLIPVQTGDPTTTRQTRLEGGDEGNRTPDPRLAKAVLYQLSYVPGHYQTSAQTAGSGSTKLVASIHRSSSACAACMRR